MDHQHSSSYFPPPPGQPGVPPPLPPRTSATTDESNVPQAPSTGWELPQSHNHRHQSPTFAPVVRNYMPPMRRRPVPTPSHVSSQLPPVPACPDIFQISHPDSQIPTRNNQRHDLSDQHPARQAGYENTSGQSQANVQPNWPQCCPPLVAEETGHEPSESSFQYQHPGTTARLNGYPTEAPSEPSQYRYQDTVPELRQYRYNTMEFEATPAQAQYTQPATSAELYETPSDPSLRQTQNRHVETGIGCNSNQIDSTYDRPHSQCAVNTVHSIRQATCLVENNYQLLYPQELAARNPQIPTTSIAFPQGPNFGAANAIKEVPSLTTLVIEASGDRTSTTKGGTYTYVRPPMPLPPPDDPITDGQDLSSSASQNDLHQPSAGVEIRKIRSGVREDSSGLYPIVALDAEERIVHEHFSVPVHDVLASTCEQVYSRPNTESSNILIDNISDGRRQEQPAPAVSPQSFDVNHLQHARDIQYSLQDATPVIDARVTSEHSTSSDLALETGRTAETIEEAEGLALGIKELAISGPTISPTRSNATQYDTDYWTRPPPSMSEVDEQNTVIWECPRNRELIYETTWYHLPDVPDFLVCTRCHDLYISKTNLVHEFEKTRHPKGRCRFNVPRITSSLLPRCVDLGDVQPLKDYMNVRLEVKDCKAKDGCKGKEGFKWFKINREDVGRTMSFFVACEACHEEIIKGSSYANEFVVSDKPQPVDDIWLCDLSFEYARKTFLKSSESKVPFLEWTAAATRRFEIPKCEGKTVEASSREWVRLRQPVDDMVICETCYMDSIALTPIEDDFEFIPIAKPVRGSEWLDHALGYRQEEPTAWTCDMRSNMIEGALEFSIKRRDISLFRKAAAVILTSPPCTNEGIANGTWYTLVGGCENYNLCVRCYTAFVETWGFSRFYERAATTGTSERIICNFHVASPRCLQGVDRFMEARETGRWSVYTDFLKKYLNLPECPRENHVDNRKWYGYGDCLVCQECYESFCQSRSSGLKLELTNELITESRMCCMYSPRMRQKWVEAAEKGDPQDLIDFSRLRHQVYARTVPQIKMLREMQQLQMMTAMSAGFAGLMYQGASSIQTISGNTDGNLYGNSSVGWHETENGATSAQLFNQMSSGMSSANSPSSWMQIFQLTAQWNEVE